MVNFIDVFGSSNRVKVVEFFLDHYDIAYTRMALSRLVGVSRRPLLALCDDLVRVGFLKPVGKKFALRFFNVGVKSLRDCLEVLRNESV